MNNAIKTAPGQTRLLGLKVQNFRSLRDVSFHELTPLTVLVGPNGSGKSTVFDVLAFLAECFESGLRAAWDRRGRAAELVSRGSAGPVVIDLDLEQPDRSTIAYHMAIRPDNGSAAVSEEWLDLRESPSAPARRLLEYRMGDGYVRDESSLDGATRQKQVRLTGPDIVAVNALGQLADNPRVAALRGFITEWRLSYFSTGSGDRQMETGPHRRISPSGDNVANVIQYLAEEHPDRLAETFLALRRRVPHLERLVAETLPDGRLLLRMKDVPFERPILARFASEGTLKLLAYLLLLHDPEPPPLMGIEEPENYLHPRLLQELGEDFRSAAEDSQLLVTTHSPFFLNAMRPEEVWVLWRDESGFTRTTRVSRIGGITEALRQGALLGHLWMEGRFGVGDPLTRAGAPTRPISP